MGLDFPYINGIKDQRDEYYYKKIVAQRPDLDNTPELLYGDKELMWLRFVNDGQIPLEMLRGEVFATPKDFGAKGDGITDDTLALKAWASSSHLNLFLPVGTFNVSSDGTSNPVLVSAVAGRRIYGPGVIRATSTVIRLLDLTAVDQTVTINVEGNDFIANAIRVNGVGGCIVENCRISNLKSTTFSVIGINSTSNDGVIIRNNYIRNLNSVGDVTGGNGNGLTRGIALGLTAPATRDNIIEENVIINCLGEEGDSIVVIASNGAGTYYDGRTMILDNKIDTFTRRAIKTQAGRTTIEGNEITNSITDVALLPNRMNVIAVIQGGDQIIRDNTLNGCLYFTQISAQYEEGKVYNNIRIENNKILGVADTVTTAIFVNLGGGSNAILTDNQIEGTRQGISVGQTADVTIDQNLMITPNVAITNDTIVISSSCTKVDITRNRFRGGTSTACINNQSTGAIIENNVNFTDSVFYRSVNSAKQCIVDGNKNKGAGATISGAGAITDNYHYGFLSTTSAGNNFPKPMMCRAGGPSVEYPNLEFKQGQVFFRQDATAGSYMGWICTVSGTGTTGTFKTWGTISA